MGPGTSVLNYNNGTDIETGTETIPYRSYLSRITKNPQLSTLFLIKNLNILSTTLRKILKDKHHLWSKKQELFRIKILHQQDHPISENAPLLCIMHRDGSSKDIVIHFS